MGVGRIEPGSEFFFSEPRDFTPVMMMMGSHVGPSQVERLFPLLFLSKLEIPKGLVFVTERKRKRKSLRNKALVSADRKKSNTSCKHALCTNSKAWERPFMP